jgi:hypothetical protein
MQTCSAARRPIIQSKANVKRPGSERFRGVQVPTAARINLGTGAQIVYGCAVRGRCDRRYIVLQGVVC